MAPSTSTSTSTTSLKRKNPFTLPNISHLPDGTHRRKLQRIKKSIVQSAKLRTEYKKIRRQEEQSGFIRPSGGSTTAPAHATQKDDGDEDEDEDEEENKDRAVEPVEEKSTTNPILSDTTTPTSNPQIHPTRHRRLSRYHDAVQQSAHITAQRIEREQLQLQRSQVQEQRLLDRRKRNKAMGKGRGAKTKSGQVKLGRLSLGLLQKVESMARS